MVTSDKHIIVIHECHEIKEKDLESDDDINVRPLEIKIQSFLFGNDGTICGRKRRCY